MKQFLLVYRHSTGKLLRMDELGPDLNAALEQRFALEKEWAPDVDVEVVVLSAPSLKALTRTHARYFRDAQGLADALNDALAS